MGCSLAKPDVQSLGKKMEFKLQQRMSQKLSKCQIAPKKQETGITPGQLRKLFHLDRKFSRNNSNLRTHRENLKIGYWNKSSFKVKSPQKKVRVSPRIRQSSVSSKRSISICRKSCQKSKNSKNLASGVVSVSSFDFKSNSHLFFESLSPSVKKFRKQSLKVKEKEKILFPEGENIKKKRRRSRFSSFSKAKKKSYFSKFNKLSVGSPQLQKKDEPIISSNMLLPKSKFLFKNKAEKFTKQQLIDKHKNWKSYKILSQTKANKPLQRGLKLLPKRIIFKKKRSKSVCQLGKQQLTNSEMKQHLPQLLNKKKRINQRTTTIVDFEKWNKSFRVKTKKLQRSIPSSSGGTLAKSNKIRREMDTSLEKLPVHQDKLTNSEICSFPKNYNVSETQTQQKIKEDQGKLTLQHIENSIQGPTPNPDSRHLSNSMDIYSHNLPHQGNIIVAPFQFNGIHSNTEYNSQNKLNVPKTCINTSGSFLLDEETDKDSLCDDVFGLRTPSKSEIH